MQIQNQHTTIQMGGITVEQLFWYTKNTSDFCMISSIQSMDRASNICKILLDVEKRIKETMPPLEASTKKTIETPSPFGTAPFGKPSSSEPSFISSSESHSEPRSAFFNPEVRLDDEFLETIPEEDENSGVFSAIVDKTKKVGNTLLKAFTFGYFGSNSKENQGEEIKNLEEGRNEEGNEEGNEEENEEENEEPRDEDGESDYESAASDSEEGDEEEDEEEPKKEEPKKRTATVLSDGSTVTYENPYGWVEVIE